MLKHRQIKLALTLCLSLMPGLTGSISEAQTRDYGLDSDLHFLVDSMRQILIMKNYEQYEHMGKCTKEEKFAIANEEAKLFVVKYLSIKKMAVSIVTDKKNKVDASLPFEVTKKRLIEVEDSLHLCNNIQRMKFIDDLMERRVADVKTEYKGN